MLCGPESLMDATSKAGWAAIDCKWPSHRVTANRVPVRWRSIVPCQYVTEPGDI